MKPNERFNHNKHKYKSLKNEEDTDCNKNENNFLISDQYYTDTSSRQDDKNIKEVINPLYNVESYIGINKNGDNSLKKTCSNSNRKNSFLDIISKTIRNLIKNEPKDKCFNDDSKNKRVLFNKISETCQIDNKNIKIDEINLSQTNDQIKFTLHLPTSIFKPEEIELFKTRKCSRKISSLTESSSSSEIDHKKKRNIEFGSKSVRRLKCHHSEQNLFDLNRQSLMNKKKVNHRSKSTINSNDYSLNSLSSFNLLNNQSNQEKNSQNGLIIFIIFTILINPLFGVVGLYYAIRSRRSNNPDESNRLRKASRQTIAAGFLISFILISLAVILFYFHSELVNLIQTNSTNSTFSNFDQSSFKEINRSNLTILKAFTIRTTVATLTSRQTKAILKITSTLRNYDRLSILIDHDLFKSLKVNSDLFQKFKVTNRTKGTVNGTF